MNVLVPVIDKVKYVHSLKEITVDIPQQIAVTKGRTEEKIPYLDEYFNNFPDNISIKLDGVMFLTITDPIKASYEVEDPEYSMVTLAQESYYLKLNQFQLI